MQAEEKMNRQEILDKIDTKWWPNTRSTNMFENRMLEEKWVIFILDNYEKHDEELDKTRNIK